MGNAYVGGAEILAVMIASRFDAHFPGELDRIAAVMDKAIAELHPALADNVIKLFPDDPPPEVAASFIVARALLHTAQLQAAEARTDGEAISPGPG